MIKILLVDDHQIVREGMKNLLESNPEYIVVGETVNVDDALKLLEKLKPDFLITDITLSNSNGIDLSRQARNLFPELHILMLSMHTSVDYIEESLNSGANGYLLKDCTKYELFDAITKILNKEIYVCKSSSQILMNKSLNQNNVLLSQKTSNAMEQDVFTALTRREIEVLKLISNGLTNKEIATKLSLSVRTVDKHRSNILHKLKVNNTAELLNKANKLNIIQM